MPEYLKFAGLAFGFLVAGYWLFLGFQFKTPSAGAYTKIVNTPAVQRAKQSSSLGVWMLVIEFALQAIAQIIELKID